MIKKQRKDLPRATLISERICAKCKGTHNHKRNVTKTESTHCTLENNCGALLYPILVNGQIRERQNKERHRETNKSYGPNGFNRPQQIQED